MKKGLFFNRKAQLTIFIILAILIVVGVSLFFVLKSDFLSESLNREMQPVYDSYLSCLEATAKNGIDLLGGQAGYIETPEFVAGSNYMPFSSQFNFLGQQVPYWLYVSGNNILREQVPTKSSMEKQLEKYISERLDVCKFDDFNSQGFGVYIEAGSVDVVINENEVGVVANNPVNIYFEEQASVVNKHEFVVSTKLGHFYDMAKKLYDYEKANMFLEKVAIDTIRLNAPVDGVELSCAPKIFIDQEIRENVSNALVENINYLKLKGNYYQLDNKDNEYFVVDAGFDTDANVNFMYAKDWTTRIEIYGDKVINPIGLQQGLGMLGFCYVPYHLVYDVDFPVLIQFWEDDFVFQFPISVIIDKNQERNALPNNAQEISLESEICKYKNQEVKIYTYDNSLSPVEARLQFKCLNTVCDIGNTKVIDGDAVFQGKVPQCLNGFILANAEGYGESKYQISTNTENLAYIVLPKKYNISLDLGNINGVAFVAFSSDNYNANVMYPETKNIELIEGYYNVSVYVYKNTSIEIPTVKDRKCVNVASSGVLGMFGVEEEKCFDINIPSYKIDFAVIGGGNAEEYITEDMLTMNSEININVPIYPVPKTTDELQNNYLLINDEIVYLEFK